MFVSEIKAKLPFFEQNQNLKCCSHHGTNIVTTKLNLQKQKRMEIWRIFVKAFKSTFLCWKKVMQNLLQSRKNFQFKIWQSSKNLFSIKYLLSFLYLFCIPSVQSPNHHQIGTAIDCFLIFRPILYGSWVYFSQLLHRSHLS